VGARLGEPTDADGSLSARTAGLLNLVETPEAMEAYLLRAQDTWLVTTVGFYL